MARNLPGSQEAEILLGELRYKREHLTEKLKQLKLLLQINNGELPKDYLGWVRQEEVSERSTEVAALRNHEEHLLKQIQDVTKELDRMGPTRAASYGKGPQFYRSGEQFFKDTSEKERVEEEKKLMNGNLRYA